MRYTLSELADMVGGSVVGRESSVITGVSSVEESQPGDITLAVDQRRLRVAHSRKQAAVITSAELQDHFLDSHSYLVSPDPKLTFARVLELFDPGIVSPCGVSPEAIVCEGVSLGEGVKVGSGAYIGPNTKVGPDTTIFPGVYIGSHVKIGRECILFPRCVVMDRCEIGDRVRLHSGCVLGADGFGYIFDGTRHVKIPQIGSVIVEEDVEIGANSCIDRATTGVTRIGRGTKIDNLVQVGHNVDIGHDCILVGQSGVAGSSVLGERCILGGQAGVSDHTVIGPGTTVMAKSVVAGKVAPDSVVSGVPARDHRGELKARSALRRLPELLDRVSKLESRLEELEKPEQTCSDSPAGVESGTRE